MLKIFLAKTIWIQISSIAFPRLTFSPLTSLSIALPEMQAQ